MLITKELTARMEACIKQTHIEFTRQHPQGKIMELRGGAACFSGFDCFFSQVIGWGFLTKPKAFEREIKMLEAFYQEVHHSRVDIELCPLVGTELAQFLSRRGYVIDELNSVSYLNLSDYQEQSNASNDQFIVAEVAAEQLASWSKVVALGFGYPEAETQFLNYARSNGAVAFAIIHQGKMVAGGTMAIHGDVCDFGVTSTLPAYRAQGLQKKLLVARLNYAKQKNVALATVTTVAGSISDCNCKKVGFSTAYTRIKLTRSL